MKRYQLLLFFIALTFGIYKLYLFNPQIILTLAGSILFPIILLIGLFLLLKRATPQQGINLTPKTTYTPTTSNIKFTDVAGIDEIKQELEELVDFIKYPERYQALGAKLPKGIILSGPPGVGKTMLAKAIAGEAGIPFFATSGSEFMEYFVGAGASKIRALFAAAKESGSAIIFIDEIDAVGKSRAAGSFASANDEREQTLNQLLVEMDGFNSNGKILIIAATNRPDVLDQALLRPGRFDRKISINLPSKKARIDILNLYAQKSPLSADIDLEQTAKRTVGFSGVDLANLINEAAILATKLNASNINQEHLNAALLRISAGIPDKSRILNATTKKRVAIHEIGHAIVSAYCGNDIQTISILPRISGALGFTISNYPEDLYLLTYEQIVDRIAILMAGRAAEEVVLGSASNGASDDLRKATELAMSACREWGFGEELASKAFLNPPKTIDKDAVLLIQSGLNKAKKIILAKLNKVSILTDKLILEETIEVNNNSLFR